MKILWIVNTLFPVPCNYLGLEPPSFGGWMYSLAEAISNCSDINLTIATTHTCSDIEYIKEGNIQYVLLPCRNKIYYDFDLETYWSELVHSFSPDVIHIHGTEYAHGLSCMRALPHLNYVVSIQGLLSIYARYYYNGMTNKDVIKNITFRDIWRMDTIFHQKRNFRKRGEQEKEYIIRTKSVIGRTSWDYAHTKQINPKVNYFFCNEMLRESFYNAVKWDIENCNKFSIFLSQAGYPIKGLHQVLKAVHILKLEFPNIKVRIAGENILASENFIQKLRLSGYGKYIRNLIRINGLSDNVEFLGVLSEDDMRKEFLSANVFISPSSIENSPNSVGEAQLLGVPVIATFVGGTPDMVEHGISGLLYRFEEIEMLADQIRKLFNDDKLIKCLSVNGIKAAKIRHDKGLNLNQLIAIYSELIKM